MCGTNAKLVIIHYFHRCGMYYFMADGNFQSQVQTQVLTQNQQLSPQQLLEVRILQMSELELEEKVRGELQENPALEESDEYDDHQVGETETDAGDTTSDDWSDSMERDDRSADFLSDDDMPDYYRDPSAGRSLEAQVAEIPYSDTVSFYDILNEQISERSLTRRQKEIAEYLIGSLDDSGLLSKSLDDIVVELAVNSFVYVDVSEVEEVLKVVQSFDPAGIGARNLQECLLLQLERRDASAECELAVRIVSDCFDDLTHLRRDRVADKMGMAEGELDAAFALIARLNPRPGCALGESEGRGARHVVPDFIVETYDGTVQFNLNNFNIPELRVSRSFTDTLNAQMSSTDSDTRQAALFIRRKLEAAQGFIDAIRQRETTMTRIMKTIIDMQQEYFLTGDETRLRPMILKDVADRTGYDISTVSRATSGKYAETDFGVIDLKTLFTDGVKGSDGVEVSVNEIYRLIRETIEAEDRSNPVTDDRISEILKEHGFNVARRTVAKYRDQLGIATSRLRR